MKIIIYVFLVSLTFLMLLFGALRYDLGIDEAWNLNWADNYNKNLVTSAYVDCKISQISFQLIFPNIVFYKLFYDIFNFSNVTNIKLFSAFCGFLSILILSLFLIKFRSYYTAIIFLILLNGMVSYVYIMTGFFGENSLFIIFTFHLIFLNRFYKDNKSLNLKLSSLFLVFTVFLKPQFGIIYLISFILYLFYVKENFRKKFFFYFTIFSFIYISLVIIPWIPHVNFIFIKSLLKSNFFYLLDFVGTNIYLEKLDRIILFQSYFPFIISLFASVYVLSRDKYRLLYPLSIFLILSILWWIFINSFETYRVAFQIIIPSVFLIAIALFDLIEFFKERYKQRILSNYVLKIFLFVALLIILLGGINLNYKLALNGNNDYTAFVLAGYYNKRAINLNQDASQKRFYNNIKILLPDYNNLTIYTLGMPYVPQFYLKKNLLSFNNINIDSLPSSDKYYLIVPTENFPLKSTEEVKILIDEKKKEIIKEKADLAILYIENKNFLYEIKIK